ncbi:unnamed protein product [Cunninghamella blakesleeana]
MAMVESPHIIYTQATQLLEEGRNKDAYTSFLSVVELSLKQLYGVNWYIIVRRYYIK